MRSLIPRRLASPLLVFLLVLAVRGASLVSLLSTPLGSWHRWTETDEHGYVEWSEHLAAGNWPDVPAYRAFFNWQRAYGDEDVWEGWYQKNAYYAGPLYPYGLAVVRLLFGSPFLPTRLLQLLLACVTSATLAAAVRAIAGKAGRAGWWAAVATGLLYGCYGPLVFHDFFLYRDGPVAHVSALLLAWPLIARNEKREIEGEREISLNEEGGIWLRRAGLSVLLLGLLGGLAMLLKQTTAPLALASIYCLSAVSSRSSFSPSFSSPSKQSWGAKRRFLAVFLIGLAGLSIPLSVLAIRNIRAGVPPLTFDTRQAIGLAWGNAVGADATTNPPAGMEEILDEAAGSTSKTARLVLEGYRETPLALPKLFLKKLATFFNAYEVPDNANFYFFRDRIRILRALPLFAPLLGVGLVGLCAALSRGVLRREEFALALVAILVPLAACLLVQTTSRYRAAVAGPLALGAGLFLLFIIEDMRRRDWKGAGLLVATAGALSLIPLFPSTIPSGRHRYSDSLVYATLLEGEGDLAGAATEVARYLAEGADDAQREGGVASLRNWYESGDRSGTLVDPVAIAPPGKRVHGK